MDDSSQLVGFLAHPNEAVRAQACQLLTGMTATSRDVFKDEKLNVIPKLCRLVTDRVQVSQHALSALVNISDEEQFRSIALKADVVGVCMTVLRDTAYASIHHLVCMLLVNLTIEEEGSKLVMQAGSNLQGLNMRRLLQKLIDPIKPCGNVPDPYEHVASILANITQVAEGRQMLTDKQRDLIRHILPQLKLPKQHLTRRVGCYRSLRNCFMDLNLHEYLLSQPDIILHIMLPLTGPSPDNKVIDDDDKEGMPDAVRAKIERGGAREPDSSIRRILLEIIGLCTRVRASRTLLRKNKIYIVIRECHKQEKEEGNDENDDLIEDAVPFFVLDEAALPEEETPTATVEEIPSDGEKEAVEAKAEASDEEVMEGLHGIGLEDTPAEVEEEEEKAEDAPAAATAPVEESDDDDDLPPLHDIEGIEADLEAMNDMD